MRWKRSVNYAGGAANVGNDSRRHRVVAGRAPLLFLSRLPCGAPRFPFNPLPFVMANCLIGLGSNLGNRRQALDGACRRLGSEQDIRVTAASRWHETAPVGGPAGQDPFLNGAVLLETSLEPETVFRLLQRIEAEQGRRRTERWGPRVLDLDLLLYDALVRRTPELTVPHPRMAWRRFVLEPAAEVAAAMLHPTTGRTIGQLLAHLNTAAPYLAIAGAIGVGKTHLVGVLARSSEVGPISEEFDTRRLETFYADPPGNAWDVEIEFLNQRTRLLGADSPRWSQPDRLWVSDFWFDQSLAYAEVWLPPERREAFRRRWHQARDRVVAPKLTVLLDAPTNELLERVRRRGRRAERSLNAERLEQIRQAILELAEQPGHGPILHLMHDDTNRVVAEVRTAVEAMG